MIALTLTWTALVIAAALALLFLAVEVYRGRRGIPARPVTTLVLIVLSLALFPVVESGAPIDPAHVPLVDVALLAGATGAGTLYAYRTSTALRLRDGRPGYRIGAGVTAGWFLLLLADVYVQTMATGQATFLGYVVVRGFPSAPGGGVVSGWLGGYSAVSLVDGLFALSTGLVIGEGIGILARLVSSRRSAVPRRAGAASPGR